MSEPILFSDFWAKVQKARRDGQRPGQALFNALPEGWCKRIIDGEITDPYEFTTEAMVMSWLATYVEFDATGRYLKALR